MNRFLFCLSLKERSIRLLDGMKYDWWRLKRLQSNELCVESCCCERLWETAAKRESREKRQALDIAFAYRHSKEGDIELHHLRRLYDLLGK